MDRFEKRNIQNLQKAMREHEGKLTEALVSVSASLAAAISLLERTPQSKKAAPSDKMFAQMIRDYKKSLSAARDVLSAL